MAEQITLQYGGRPLALEKSESLIALRPRPGMDATMQNAVAPLSTAGAIAAKEMLGGFQIIPLRGSPDETDRQLDALRANSSVETGSHVFHTSNDQVPFVPTGSVYIKFKPGVSAEKKEKLLDQSRLEITEARSDDGLIARTTLGSPNPVKVAASLQSSDLVDIAEPELATPGSLKAIGVPSDALLSEQWHLRNTGSHRGTELGFRKGADARVVAAWQSGESLGSSHILVAVIDDGFDLAHPDLSGPNKTIKPWDFTRNNNSPVPDPTTADWHGTACAGVAVGRTGGGGILGAAPGATLMPVRWGVNLSDTEIENWFGYVRTSGAWIVSCSWGALARNFRLSTRASDAIAKCAREGRGGKGCVIVFAAGNENRNVNDPAAASVNGFAIHPDVIAVAASTSRDDRSDYSNFGNEIWVCAPSNGAGGWGILTSDVTGTFVANGISVPLGYDPSEYTYEFGGTSSACPLVAGVCALILSANSDLTATEVKTILRDTARRIGPASSYNGLSHSVQFGYGCVDAEAAVAAVHKAKQGPAVAAAAA